MKAKDAIDADYGLWEPRMHVPSKSHGRQRLTEASCQTHLATIPLLVLNGIMRWKLQ